MNLDKPVLTERPRYTDNSFDIRPLPSSAIGDLDRLYYESEYLPATVASEILEANDRTYTQRLSSSKLILAADAAVPTVLGHLVIGIRTRDFVPGAYVQFLRLRGNDLASDIGDEQVIDGKIAAVARRLDEKLRAHNFVAVDLKSADREQRRADYPLVALQQLARNALLHRSYENTNAPVKVNWFDDRIEIWSAGGPFGAVTAANFGRAGWADYRNPHIVEAMKGLGLVQRFGVGIQTAISELKRNGNPAPEFEVTDSAINVIVRKRL